MSTVTVLFTCGQNHRHSISPNHTWDKDSLIEVKAQTYDEAVRFVQERFGLQYASDYPESERDDLLRYMRNGVVAKYQVR